MNKLAILGASYLQKPLIVKAKEMGIETHVFAWKYGNVVNDICDFYYDISILDKESILAKCKEIGVDGITSIASDIAMPAVNFVAHELGLVGNSIKTTEMTTDKFKMRQALSKSNIVCPSFALYDSPIFENKEELNFPLIVKPTDRSGSRGVTKVNSVDETNLAISNALNCSINKRVIVEEFIVNHREFSVESVSYNCENYVLAITDKLTTGDPSFIELAHHQPADIDDSLSLRINNITLDIINTLGIKNGFSHTELILTDNNELVAVETAARMAGDFIGSHLTRYTTGIDTLKIVIEISLGINPSKKLKNIKTTKFKSGIYFYTDQTEWAKDIILKNDPSIIQSEIFYDKDSKLDKMCGSQDRAGYFIYKSFNKETYE